MRVVLCNTKDDGGGAAIAARRLHTALPGAGVESVLAVLQKTTDLPGIQTISGRLRRALHPFIRQGERLPLAFYPKRDRDALFSLSWRPGLTHRALAALHPDIVHLHWIADSFIPLFSLARLHIPTVWTLHDTWALTGGCHILKGCTRFTEQCGCCPQLNSRNRFDLSRLGWLLREKTFARLRPAMVVPSRHMERLARQSPLLRGCRIERIPNGIDTAVFRPLNKQYARDILRLPQDVPLLLFGAVGAGHDPNKGADLLYAALQALPRDFREKAHCAVFGAAMDTAGFGMPATCLGRLHDEVTLALACSAADVLICPSREENLPNTVMEAMACGTPVAAFRTGGIPDMVTDGENGILAPCYDTAALASGIVSLLSAKETRQRMGARAREKVLREYDSAVVAARHAALYSTLQA